jgi:hypothetical protein
MSERKLSSTLLNAALTTLLAMYLMCLNMGGI